MARLDLVLGNTPRRLLEQAADGFLAEQSPGVASFPSPGYWLILRQGGLREDLLALAARRGIRGWFDPPLCVFADLPTLLVGERVPGLPDHERVVLITQLLRRVSPRILAPAGHTAFVDAVDRFFGELMGGDVSPADLEAAFARSGERDAFQQQRDADLCATYAAYRSLLATNGLLDPRARWIHTARAVRADAEGLARRLGGRRELRILGLQDLRGGWRVLLAALRDSPALDRIALYTSVPLHEYEGLQPDAVEVLDEPASLAARLFTASRYTADAGPRVNLVSAPDQTREVEIVAARVRRLIDEGHDASRIAIVARQARPYTDLLLHALRNAGVEATTRRRVGFAEIPVVRSILALFAVARAGWSRHGLVELAQQPYVGRELDAYLINYIGYRRRVQGLDAWKRAFEELLEEARAAEQQKESGTLDRFAGWVPHPDRVEQGLRQFDEFAARAHELDGSRPLRAWLEWLEERALGDEWGIESRLYDVPADRWDVVRLDTLGLRGVRSIVSEWRRALDRWGGDDEVLDAGQIEDRLRDMFNADVAFWTHTHRSVQVLEGLAAAHRIFDHVFIVGMAGERFPLRRPLSPLFDAEERDALAAAGLPLETDAEWDRRERELFRAIVAAGTTSITATWPRLGTDGTETVPSAWFEELEEITGTEPEHIETHDVVVPGAPLIASEDAVALAVQAARIEQIRATGALSPWNGLVESVDVAAAVTEKLGPDRIWSATQIESFAKCPWSFFSQRLLRLEKLEDPDIDIDPRARGSLLHDALHRFFDAAQQRAGGAVFLLPPDLGWASALAEQALDEAIDAADARIWLGQPALRATKRAELHRMLQKYLEREAEQNQAALDAGPRRKIAGMLRTAVEAHEVEFEDLEVDLGGERIRLRGSIDRIETGFDDRVPSAGWVAAVDYKTSRWSTPGSGEQQAWTDGVVIQVPLYAHVLKQLRPGARVARVEYRALRNAERVHSLELVRVNSGRHGPALEANPEDEERMRQALAAAGAHIRRARQGEFPARPAPSCMCPPYCHAWEICRVKGGPRRKW